jgi:hypothetical protein
MSPAALDLEVGRGSYGDGCMLAAGLLETVPGWVGSMRVGVLLLSIRKMGQVKVGALCKQAGVRSLDRRVGELTPRQREVLAGLLREVAEGKWLKR